MSNSNGTHWSNSVFKDRYIMGSLRILLGVIVVLAIYILIRVLLGYNVKLFGLETNPGKQRQDTTSVSSKPPIDTNKINIHPIFANPTKLPQKISNDTNKVKNKIEQKNVSGKNEINQNSGENKGIIGGENNTITNIGIIPRNISEAELMPLLNQIPDKNCEVRFVSYGFGDAEINAVKAQITDILKKHGFKNIINSFFYRLGNIEIPPKIELVYSDSEKVLEFLIPPAK